MTTHDDVNEAETAPGMSTPEAQSVAKVFPDAAVNTDKELWREPPGDYYAPSLFVTAGGGIGIDVGGYVVVMPIRSWHALAVKDRPTPTPIAAPDGGST